MRKFANKFQKNIDFNLRIRNNNLLILVHILIISVVLSACSTTKKAALDCPPISINKSNKLLRSHKHFKNSNLFARNKTKFVKHANRVSKKIQPKELEIVNNTVPSERRDNAFDLEGIKYLNKGEFLKELIASTDNKLIPSKVQSIEDQFEILDQQARCDTIELNSGAIIVGKVEEIGQTEIKYRKCNNLSGPIYAIAKSDVLAIFYNNGTHDILVRNNVQQNPVQQNSAQPSNNNSSPDNGGTKKTEGFAVAGFIAGLAGLFVFPYLLGAVAIIFGAIGLGRIKKNPSKLKGKGLAIASLIIGIAGIVATLIIVGAI